MRGKYDRKIMVLCDTDERYITRMSEYFTSREEFPFALWFFTKPHELMDFLRDNDVNVLFLQEELYKECGDIVADNVFLLSSDPEKCRAGTADTNSYYLYRFQSAEDMLQAVYQNCTVRISLPTMRGPDSACKVFGFYTPLGRCLQTTAALTLGQILAKNDKVLYLNFKGCDDVVCHENRDRYDMSDLIYCFLHSKESFLTRLSTMRQQLNKLDYIESARTYMDIQAISAADWLDMMKVIRDSGLYGCIILDLSTQMQGMVEMLRLCERVFMMELPDAYSARCIKRYEEMLRFVGEEDVLNRTVRVLIPEDIWNDSFKSIPNRPEEYPYSAIGMLMNHLAV